MFWTRRRPKAWNLLDTFDDPRAAGTIPGTYATDGVNVRTPTDTESKLTIAGGALVCAGGKAAPAWGDPGLWESVAHARTAGKLLIARIKIADVTQQVQIGWDDNLVGEISRYRFYFLADLIAVLEGASGPFVFVPVDATDHWLAIPLRATGAQYFIKSDNKWLLLYTSNTGSVTPLYAGISNYHAVWSLYDWEVPTGVRWLAAPLVSDSFAVDGALAGRLTDGLGHAETSGPGSGGSGTVWAGATWTTAGGAALNTPTLGAEIWDADAAIFTAGTYSWVAAGTNLIANVANALQITYVDNGFGAYCYLRDSYDLNANLTVGIWYRLIVDAKVNAASSVQVTVDNGGGAAISQTVTATEFATLYFIFRAASATAAIIQGGGMGAGEILTLDNLGLKSLTLSELHSNLGAMSTPNVICETAITHIAGTQSGFVLRLNSAAAPTDAIYVHDNGAGSIVCEKLVSSVWTPVSTTAFSYVANARFIVDCNSTSYRVYYNNALIYAGVIAEATINDGRLFGGFSTHPNNLFSYMHIYAKGTSNEYAILDSWLP